MHAEQLTNPRSNLRSSIFNLQPTTFVPQRTAFVPQTTNQEHTPITSNCTRKQAFVDHQSGQNIFVPRKELKKFFYSKIRDLSCIVHLASSVSTFHPRIDPPKGNSKKRRRNKCYPPFFCRKWRSQGTKKAQLNEDCFELIQNNSPRIHFHPSMCLRSILSRPQSKNPQRNHLDQRFSRSIFFAF
jgi:hypothetical protein